MYKRSILALVAVVAVFSLALAQDRPLTSDDVLRKSAQAYQGMKTFFEEGTVVEDDDPAVKYTLACKRPDALKWNIAGPDGDITLLYRDGELIHYDANERQYIKSKCGIDDALDEAPFAIMGMRFAADPYQYLKSRTESVGDLAEADLDGRKVYAIDVVGKDSTAYKCYFDKEKLRLVGVDGEFDERSVVIRAGKMLVDEFPKDAAGKEIDVLGFTLPEGAMQMTVEDMRPRMTGSGGRG